MTSQEFKTYSKATKIGHKTHFNQKTSIIIFGIRERCLICANHQNNKRIKKIMHSTHMLFAGQRIGVYQQLLLILINILIGHQACESQRLLLFELLFFSYSLHLSLSRSRLTLDDCSLKIWIWQGKEPTRLFIYVFSLCIIFFFPFDVFARRRVHTYFPSHSTGSLCEKMVQSWIEYRNVRI